MEGAFVGMKGACLGDRSPDTLMRDGGDDFMKVDVDLDEATLCKAMQVAKSEDPKHVLELALRAFVRAATQSAPQKITLTKRRRSRVKLAKKPQTVKEEAKFFGHYLVQQGLIDEEQLERGLALMRERNRKMGDLAMDRGFLSDFQVDTLRKEQRRVDMFFGDLAVKRGFMSPSQIEELLDWQRVNKIRIGEALVELELLDADTVREHAGVFGEDLGSLTPKVPTSTALPEPAQPAGTGQPLEIGQVEKYIADFLPRMLRRLADTDAKVVCIGNITQFAGFQYRGLSRLDGDPVWVLGVSLDEVLAREVLEGLFGEDVEEIFDDELPFEDAVTEFLSMLGANLVTHLESLGFEYRSGAPMAGATLEDGQGIRIDTATGSGILVVQSAAATG